jgi:hypothetical protein
MGSIFVLATNDFEPSRKYWIIDSGASSNLTWNKEAFTEYKATKGMTIYLSNGAPIEVLGTGTVDISSHIDGKNVLIQVHNVLHAPDLAFQLLSESHVTQQNVTILKEGTTSTMIKGDQVILRGRRSADNGQLYIVDMPVEHSSLQDTELALLTQESTELWH